MPYPITASESPLQANISPTAKGMSGKFLCVGKHASNNITKYTSLSPNDNGYSN